METVKLPKPTRRTSPPLFSSPVITEKTASTADCASPLEIFAASATADNNQIQFCDGSAYKWNPGLPPAGGIALARADKVSITGNRVTSNGTKAKAPVCGVWIGKSRGVVIRENWIEDNRPAPDAETLAATQGGVRLEEAWVAIASKDNVPSTVGISPAVDISGNFIDALFGHAVYVIGEGAMVIRDNRLKSYGALNMELKTPATGFEELGRSYSSVLVFNFGLPAMFSVFLQAFGYQFAAGELTKATPGPALRRALSGGQIRFAGNQIRLDLRDPDISFVPANVGIFTLDDLPVRAQPDRGADHRRPAHDRCDFLRRADRRGCFRGRPAMGCSRRPSSR